MHDLMWALYWIDVLSAIPKAVGVGSFVAGVLGLATGIFSAMILSILGERDEDITKKAVKRGFLVGLLCLFLAFAGAFIPSKQTMYLMLGVNVTDKAINSEMGQKVQKLLNSKLDEYLGVFDSEIKKGDK